MAAPPQHSFNAIVREELARIDPDDSTLRRAELAALVKSLGTLHVARDGIRLQVATRQASLARKLVRWFKLEFGVAVRIAVAQRTGPVEGNVYQIQLLERDAVATVLRELALLGGDGRLRDDVPAALLPDREAIAAYLRGMFLGAGHVYPPQRGYQLELWLRERRTADGCRRLLDELGLPARVVPRRDGYAVYLRNGDQIVHFLSMVGAHAATLAYEDARVYRELRGRVNRLINAETANLEKAVAAGVRQVQAIKQVMASDSWSRLPEGLRQLAQLRLEHPELSMRELGERMNPPLTKVAVAHRMRRLQALADKLRQTEEAG